MKSSYEAASSKRLAGGSVRVTSGEYEILASGSVIAYPQSPITFELVAPAERGGETIFLTVLFREEAGEPESHYEPEILDPQHATMALINWRNPLGAGMGEPLPLGTLGGREWLINFRAYPLAGGEHTLIYTFYLGDEVGE